MTNEQAKTLLNNLARADITDEYGEMVDMQPYEEAVDMAIKALEQEPCDDAVSRQAVLDMIGNVPDYNDGMVWEALSHAQRDVALLPSVKPQEPMWIPVSERLPEDGQNVLFCDIDDDIMIGYHVKGRPDTHFSQDGTYEDMKNVRAWMPLPELYKADKESEE